MLRYSVLLVLCLYMYTGMAQDVFSFTQGKPEQKRYYEEIPYEKVGGKIIVTVEVGGKPRRFIWDTGATVLVTESLAKELGCKVIQSMPLYDAYNQVDTAKIVRVDKIKIGGTSFHGVPAGILSDHSIFAVCFEVDGFIGSNICWKSVVEFRDDEQKIILTDRLKRLGIPKQKGIKMLHCTQQSSPIIPVKVAENMVLELLFDTGDEGFLGISERNYNQFVAADSGIFRIKEVGHGSNSVGLWGNAPKMDKLLLGLPYFGIGKSVFRNVFTETMNNDNSRMGLGLLDYGRVVIDYSRSRFYFVPFTEGEIEVKPEKVWEVMPTFMGDKLVIGLIWGDFKEVAIGDEILEVNGIKIAEKDPCQLLIGSLVPEDAEQMDLLIRTASGEEKTVVIRAI